MGELILPLQQQRIYDFLCAKANLVVHYHEFESIISCSINRNCLAHTIYRLRKRVRGTGVKIETVWGRGYRLTQTRKRPMHLTDLTADDHSFALAIQDALATVMENYVESVPMQSQLAILGIAIGAVLAQLPEPECEYCKSVFLRNFDEADELAVRMMLN